MTRRQQHGGSIRKWAAKAHAIMKENKGYSRGAQMLLDRFGSRISNPHMRALAQSGIHALSQAGYGRYCKTYGARKCVKQMVKSGPNDTYYYRCGKYSARACIKKRKPRRAVAYATRPGTKQLVMA